MAPVRRPPRLAGLARKGSAQAFIFLAPALVLLIIFLIYPMVWTIALSFNSGLGLRFQWDDWVGFEHYSRLFTQDSSFLDLDELPGGIFVGEAGALFNNMLWVVFYTALCLLFGLVIAVLAAKVRYEAIVKAIIFVPMAISATAVALIWLFVYSPDPEIGVLNASLSSAFGIDPISWMGRSDTVNWAIIIAYVWASAGFAMVVLSAALKGIPVDIIEAARTDGANEWNIFRRIQLPMLSLPIAVVTVWLIINVIKVFDIVFIMTRGGPGTSSRVIAYTMYRETFEGGKGGYGAAVAVVMLILIIPIMAFNIRHFRSEAIQG